jgi:raffinose/stachyose/melibiose transport system permease protein
MKNERKGKKPELFDVIRYIILIAFVIIAFVPFAILPIVSLKTKSDFMKYPLELPRTLNFANYVTVFKRATILRAFFNSFLITAGSLFVELFIGTLASYAITKMNFKKAALFAACFMVPMIFPVQTITIPVYIIYKNIHFLNTFYGMIILYAAIGLPMVVFMMTSFMKTIPIQISESAMIDGASHFTIYLKLIVPLLKPVISTLVVISGLSIWNDFYLPQIMLTSTKMKTMPLKVYDFFGQYTSDWTLICTCIIYVIVPIIILYCIMQKNIISGIAAGAVKG